MRRAAALIPIALLAAALTGVAGAVALPSAGASCPASRAGAVAVDRKGQTLVCMRLTKTKLQWKLPAPGSFLRPIPLGQSAEAGAVTGRFRVRVTNVNFAAADEVAAGSAEMVQPPAGVQYVRVKVEATFVGPGGSGSTDHVWYARDGRGTDYAASAGCGGGYGTDFDVTAVAATGVSVSGGHCFEVQAAGVTSLELRVDGFGDRPTTFFALR